MNKVEIEKASPLYSYWRSDQSNKEESKRLLKANKTSKAVYLFEKEPYKWECLFQSIIQELIDGNLDSIRGIKVLLSTINEEEQEKLIKYLSGYEEFADPILNQIKDPENSKSNKKNIFRALKILIVIFTNTYGIKIKRKRNHIYEETGYFCNKLVLIIRSLFDKSYRLKKK